MSQDITTSLKGAGHPPRLSALLAFTDVLKGRSLSEAIPSHLGALEPRDQGLARAILMSAVKHHHGHEKILLNFMDKPLKKPQVIAALHLGMTEILTLATPEHAAVNTYVEIAKRDKALQPYKNLINAILRRVVRERDTLQNPAPLDLLPDWLSANWQKTYGDVASDMAAAMLAEPALDLCVKEKGFEDALLAAREGFSPSQGFVRLTSPSGVETLPGFKEGHWWVQDFSAQLPALLLGDVKGRRVADFCAAPGGKAMQLAARGAEVFAYDKSEKRLKRLYENLARTKLKALVSARDLAKSPPNERFDAILIDAPCSATGTLRRNPDVLIHRQKKDVEALAELQFALLSSAITALQPNGQIVYSVCSLEEAEGEAMIARVLKAFPQISLSPIRPEELPILAESISKNGMVRILPTMLKGPTSALSGVDGFFAARLTL